MKPLLLPVCCFQAITLRLLWVVSGMLLVDVLSTPPQGCKLLGAIHNSCGLDVPAKMSVPVKKPQCILWQAIADC